MMRRFKFIISLLVVAFAFAAGWWTNDGIQRSKVTRELERLVDLDVGGARAPLWAGLDDCREPTAAEQKSESLGSRGTGGI